MNAENQYCDTSKGAQNQNKLALPAPLAAFLAIGIGFAAVPAVSAQDDKPALQLVHSVRPLVIAHRGYCEFAPENTLPSFDLAIRAGADLVELDYHHSKDGQPIVIHDGTLDRTTDATNRLGRVKVAVGALTVDELKQFDAGTWFDPKYAGTRLPLLIEALEFIQGRGGVTLIERKGGDPATLVALLRKHNWVNRVVVQSFDWRYLREF
ncbi:MAG: glycerophosphodiester phosphodiesterase, partial [Verrucomicrobiia bacterium]